MPAHLPKKSKYLPFNNFDNPYSVSYSSLLKLIIKNIINFSKIIIRNKLHFVQNKS
jgi:hypothetical protein